MLDKFMERIVQSAADAYKPRLVELAEIRRKELLEMKSKVRTEPSAVEAWLDSELEKVEKLDPNDLLRGIK